MAKRHNDGEPGAEDTKGLGGPPISIKEELFPGAESAGAGVLAGVTEDLETKERSSEVSIPVSALPVSIEQVQELVAQLRAEFIFELGRVRDQLQSQMMSEEGIEAELVGGVFNCPKCGLRLNSPAMTGMKGQMYEHPFDTSPKLSGQQCEMKGKRFRSPIVFMRNAPPLPSAKPLTPKPE